MVEGGERLRFALEACETIRVLRKQDGQDLDGDVARAAAEHPLPDILRWARPDDGRGLMR